MCRCCFLPTEDGLVPMRAEVLCSDTGQRRNTEVVKRLQCGYCRAEFESTASKLRRMFLRGGEHCGCQRSVRSGRGSVGRTPANKLGDLERTAREVYRASTKGGRELTVDQVRTLITQPCHYCGQPPSMYRPLGQGRWRRVSTVPTGGIDRRDSTQGYTPDNCLPCCADCNYLKRDRPYEVFMNKIKVIYENSEGRWVGPQQ